MLLYSLLVGLYLAFKLALQKFLVRDVRPLLNEVSDLLKDLLSCIEVNVAVLCHARYEILDQVQELLINSLAAYEDVTPL